LEAAIRAFESGDWETAVSRGYYALYHAVIALLEARAGVVRRRWDHVQVQLDFRTHFARRGFLFTTRDAQYFEELYRARLAADYEAERVEARRATRHMNNVRELYEIIVRAV
jgi:uncharacterized protein (UPF0332 family)